MDPTRIPGWHGKLPTLGDFATRRLDPDFVAAWDAWLSHGLALLRLQPGWLDGYLASPSWRFLLLPGVLAGPPGARPWAGVLMPSVDRVGRYYPLTIALALAALPATGGQVESLWNWLVRLDEAAADALHDDWSIETLEAELQRLPLPAAAAAPPAMPTAGEPVQALSLDGLPHAGALLASQAAAAWAERAHGLAFWSAQPDIGDARVLCSQGLERGCLVARLLGTTQDNPR